MLSERTFSDLLRHSGEVAKDAERHDVLISRRDGPDLMLVDREREEGLREAFAALASVVRSMLAAMQDVKGWVDDLGEFLAWTSFLPADERRQFLSEFTLAIIAGEQANTFAPASQVLREWKATAMVHADPELAAVLRERVPDEEGDNVVPPPPAVGAVS